MPSVSSLLPVSPAAPVDQRRGPPELAFGGIVRAYGLIQRIMRPYFLQFGLNSSQWAILRHLLRAEEEEGRADGLRLVELGQRLLVQPPSITTLVRRLEKAGLVRHAVTPNDRRSIQLRLTEEGRKLVQRVLLRHKEQVRRVVGGLDDRELEVFCQLVERLNTHLATTAAQLPDTLN